jgi:hypothetical protein
MCPEPRVTIGDAFGGPEKMMVLAMLLLGMGEPAMYTTNMKSGVNSKQADQRDEAGWRFLDNVTIMNHSPTDMAPFF